MEQRGPTAQDRGPGSEHTEAVRVWLLGGFRVMVGAREVGANLRQRRKAVSLVKLLALAPGHAMHRERIADLLWPDLDAKPATNNLHRVLHTARRVFDPSPVGPPNRYIVLKDEVIRLCPDSDLVVDVDEFEAAASVARRSGEPAAYRSAIDLYGGDLLPEDLYEEWAMERREELRRLYEQVSAGRSPTHAGMLGDDRSPSPPNNLPISLTSFVGRERSFVDVRRLLSMSRLLTLIGAGGAGKTRLALEVAGDLIGAYPDGVWFIELAPLADPMLVPRTVATALDVREQPGLPLARKLADHLRVRRMLLILDNCEHVVGETARLVEELLKSCPHLRILATSREPLGVPGETVWSVPPLSLPREGATARDLVRASAVRLFVDRARSRLPDFELTEDNAGAVARVCAKLDGIPLAIELATARVGALAIEQVASELEDSLGLLVGGGRTADPRQRTMAATLDWSYRLLEEEERSLLARLSVFAGGMTLPAVECVCSNMERDRVLALLLRLVEKSLLVVQDTAGAAARYRMLEPIRQYAWEKLEARGEPQTIRARHADYYLSLALEVGPGLSGPDAAPGLAVLEAEVGNLRGALSWALDEDAADERVETGLRLANALARFWDTHGPAEGRRWFEKALSRGVQLPIEVRAEALREAGFIAVYEWDPRSVQMLDEAFELYRQLGHQPDILLAVEHLGHALAHHATPEVAAPILDKVGALLKDSGDPNIEAHYANFLGFAAEVESNHEETRLRWKEALAIYRALGDVRSIARCLPSLGIITLSHHDVEEAARYFEEGLAMVRAVRYKTIIFFHLMGLAAVATHRGQARRAAKLFGASEVLQETGGFSLATLSSSEYDYEGYLATVQAGLDDGPFEAAWNEGRMLSLDEAIEYALGLEDASATSREEESQVPYPLTRREREVAILLGQGETNRSIAARLGISRRTTENHVANILKKLGLRSRSQVAAWAIQVGLLQDRR